MSDLKSTYTEDSRYDYLPFGALQVSKMAKTESTDKKGEDDDTLAIHHHINIYINHT